MEQETKKINRSIKIYPLFASFTGDLIFFVPIDTLLLDRAIKEKTRQNNSDFNVGRDNLKDNIYYSN